MACILLTAFLPHFGPPGSIVIMPFTQVTIDAFGNFLRFINSFGNVLAASKMYFGPLAIALVNDPSLCHGLELLS